MRWILAFLLLSVPLSASHLLVIDGESGEEMLSVGTEEGEFTYSGRIEEFHFSFSDSVAWGEEECRELVRSVLEVWGVIGPHRHDI